MSASQTSDQLPSDLDYARRLRGEGHDYRVIWQALRKEGSDDVAIDAAVRKLVAEDIEVESVQPWGGIGRSTVYGLWIGGAAILLHALWMDEGNGIQQAIEFVLGCAAIIAGMFLRDPAQRRLDAMVTETLKSEIGPGYEPVGEGEWLAIGLGPEIEVVEELPGTVAATCEHCGVVSKLAPDEATGERFYCPACGRPSALIVAE